MGIFPAGTTTLKIGCYVEQPKFNVVSTPEKNEEGQTLQWAKEKGQTGNYL